MCSIRTRLLSSRYRQVKRCKHFEDTMHLLPPLYSIARKMDRARMMSLLAGHGIRSVSSTASTRSVSDQVGRPQTIKIWEIKVVHLNTHPTMQLSDKTLEQKVDLLYVCTLRFRQSATCDSLAPSTSVQQLR